MVISSENGNSPPKNVKKRQRKSRFAPSSATMDIPSIPADMKLNKMPLSASVSDALASFRVRMSERKEALTTEPPKPTVVPKNATELSKENEAFDTQKRTSPSASNGKTLPGLPPSKRQRTGRSRFSQATPSNTPMTGSISAIVPPVNSGTMFENGSSFPSQSLGTLSIAPLRREAAPSTNQIALSSLEQERLDVKAIPIAPVKTVNINRKADKKQKLAAVLKISKNDLLDTDPISNPYFDPKLPHPGRLQRPLRKQINIIPKGLVATRAEKDRERATVQVTRSKYVSKLTDGTAQASDVPVLPPLAEDLSLRKTIAAPNYEWWDVPFLAYPDRFLGHEKVEANDTSKDADAKMSGVADHNVDCDDLEIRKDRITHYVHHPPKIKPSKPFREPPVVPLMLTKNEMKKLRRQRRMEAHQEKQEMIAAGLVPPPPPKIKYSNMMRVLATETSIDPTKVESEVREQVEARRKKHEADNEARKKSNEERREKEREKREKDRQTGLMAAVFWISDLSDATNRFKVIRNARQMELTGVMITFKGCNVVVVEGGAKMLRKYKKLMLHRISWEAQKQEQIGNIEPNNGAEGHTGDTREIIVKDDSEPSTDALLTPRCVLVWEGVILSSSFTDFAVFGMRSEFACRKLFREHELEHYWDLCLQAGPSINDNTKIAS